MQNDKFSSLLSDYIRRFRPLVIPLLLGAFIAYPYLEWLRSDTGLSSRRGLLFIFAYASFFFGTLVYFLLYKYVLPVLIFFPKKWRWFWIIFSVCFGVWLSIAIPIDFPSRPDPFEVNIIATGEKNPQSNGSEVWVSRIVTSNGKVPTEDFVAGEGWEIREGLWFSRFSNGALIWKGTSQSSIQLVFVSHPWSGIVEVVWNGQSQRVDLYDPSGKEIALDLEPLLPNNPSLLKQAIFVLGTGFGIGLIILMLGTWLLKQVESVENFEKRTSPINFLRYSVISMIGLSVYWLVYFPGIMAFDVVDQWGQMLSFRINDAHPAAHTLYFWLLTRLWNSPAVVALFQILVFSLLVGKIMDFFEQKGISNKLLLGITILFGVNPLNAINVISLWKDTLFSIFFLIIFYFLIRIVWSNGLWLDSVKNITLLFLASLGLTLVRHNGIFVTVALTAFLIIFYPSHRRYRVIAGLIALLTIRSLITGPLYDLLKIEKIDVKTRFTNSYIAYYLGYFVSERPDLLNDQQRDYLDKIYPIVTKWHFDNYCMNSIGFNYEIISKIDHKAQNLLFRLVMNHPLETISTTLNHGALVWKIRQLDSYTWLYHEPLDEVYIFPLEWGPKLEKCSFFPTAAKFIGNLMSKGKLNSSVNWLFFRPATYLYFSIFIIFFFAFRNRNLSILTLSVPILVQSTTMLLLLTCQDFRYQYPVYVVSLVILPLVFLKNYSQKFI